MKKETNATILKCQVNINKILDYTLFGKYLYQFVARMEFSKCQELKRNKIQCFIYLPTFFSFLFLCGCQDQTNSFTYLPNIVTGGNKIMKDKVILKIIVSLGVQEMYPDHKKSGYSYSCLNLVFFFLLGQQIFFPCFSTFQ